MDELPADLRAFLLNHPFLQLTDGKKVSGQIKSHYMKDTCSYNVMLAVLLMLCVMCSVMARCDDQD